MLLSEMAAMRIWSKARVKKAAKVLQKGTVLSRVAQPTAMLTWGQSGRHQPRGRGGQEAQDHLLGGKGCIIPVTVNSPSLMQVILCT